MTDMYTLYAVFLIQAVGTLASIAVIVGDLGPARDQQNGDRVCVGIYNAGGSVRRSWTRDGQSHTHIARGSRITVCDESGPLLVPNQDVLDRGAQ